MIDKALYNGYSYTLSQNGDLEVVDGDLSNLQSAQNRCLSIIGSWIYDTSFGSGLMTAFNDKSPFSITNEEVYGVIYKGLEPMILDGRITEIQSVNITNRTPDGISIEIKIKLTSTIGVINYNLSL